MGKNTGRTTEATVGLTAEDLWGLVYECAGAASAPFMRDHPHVMPSEEIIEGVNRVMAEHGFADPPRGYRQPPHEEELIRELSHVMNGRENASDTPDFVLGEYLFLCLRAFEITSRRREKWWGHPGNEHEEYVDPKLIPPKRVRESEEFPSLHTPGPGEVTGPDDEYDIG